MSQGPSGSRREVTCVPGPPVTEAPAPRDCLWPSPVQNQGLSRQPETLFLRIEHRKESFLPKLETKRHWYLAGPLQ